MLAQALEANGAVVYILGRRQEVLEKAAATAVRDPSLRDEFSDDNILSRSMAISTQSRQT
jgi:NADP-dependent 3-hydroxy acid dehydrogenase YdfG